MKALNKRDLDNPAPFSSFSSAGLIIRQKEPKNLEAPFDRIDSYLTPTELFYIRRPCATACVATLEIRLAYAEKGGAVHAPSKSQRRERCVATDRARSKLRRLRHQPLSPN